MNLTDAYAQTDLTREHLAKLLERKGIASHAQPIVDLFSGEVFGYEMLARGEGPFVSPEVLFEQAALWGLEEEVELACREAALSRISELTADHPKSYFFVNISPDSVGDPRFQQSFHPGCLSSRGINVQSLVLEITETASVEDYGHFEEAMRFNVEKGLRIALDDFGSGHSGLITLVAVTPHFMKIDKAIVRNIDTSPYKQKLVRAISSFAGQVGSDMIAEGIESWDELSTVFRLGVRYVQGFLIARPQLELEPLAIGVKNELRSLMTEYHHKQYSVDVSISNLVTIPQLVSVDSTTGADLDRIFRRNHSITHVVIERDRRPEALITRQHFYSMLSGQYGYSVYSKRYIDSIAKREMLVVEDRMDLRTLGKLAMARPMNELYDPIIVTDSHGRIIGTITMRQLLRKAFDTEIRLATSANPLTQLPGNTVIGEWLDKIIRSPEYSIIYGDLDRFKEYNDCYGFASGDGMIKLVADVLGAHAKNLPCRSRLGHIGGDDFIMICEGVVTPDQLESMCRTFDVRKRPLFSAADLDRGYYTSVNRKGETVQTPLVTLSLAVITSSNYADSPHPGELGQNVAKLKKKVKSLNAETGTSGYIFERRKL